METKSLANQNIWANLVGPRRTRLRAQGSNNSESNFNSHYFGVKNLTKDSICVVQISVCIAVALHSPKHPQCVCICASHVFGGLPSLFRLVVAPRKVGNVSH